MDVNALIAQAQNTEGLEDQTQTTSGGDFEFETPPAGPTPARFVGYVEMGKRKQRPYQGKEKPDADEVRLYFELNGPKHQRTVEVEGEEKTFTNIISIKLTKKLNDKATFVKLFKKMAYGRDSITHMAQMLGEGFIVKVVHNVESNPPEGKKPRTFANLRDEDGSWTIGAPSFTDPLSGETKDVPVPEPTQAIKLLLWDNPTQEQWDSIFIDGTRTVKDAKGNETEKSKNWMQEDIVQNAVNFEGSALQAMLGGLGSLDLNNDVLDEGDTGAPETPAEDKSEEKAPETPKEAEKGPAPAENASADDLMASLGLT